MTVNESVWGLVLAGGKSRRMGADKASLTQNGESQLSRAVKLLQAHTGRTFVSTSADQQDDPLRQRFEKIVDAYEDLGPLAGILSAMDMNPAVSWLILACDLPAVDDVTITHLLNRASAEYPATAYRSVHDDLPEPLCAIYRPTARPIIDRYVNEGCKCPRKILINSPTQLLTQPNPGALHNINSPEDLAGTGIEQTL
ncbi:MAG: molybdenum cofactor guanylyltransferase [Woeseiaceae bacterium]